MRVRISSKDIPDEEEGRFLRPDMGALVSFLRMTENPEGAKNTNGKK